MNTDSKLWSKFGSKIIATDFHFLGHLESAIFCGFKSSIICYSQVFSMSVPNVLTNLHKCMALYTEMCRFITNKLTHIVVAFAFIILQWFIGKIFRDTKWKFFYDQFEKYCNKNIWWLVYIIDNIIFIQILWGKDNIISTILNILVVYRKTNISNKIMAKNENNGTYLSTTK